MKNVILKDNDVTQLIAKLYVDGSLSIVQRWKKARCQNEICYLQSDSVYILRIELESLFKR